MDPFIQDLAVLLLTILAVPILLLVVRIGLKLAEANESWWDYSDEALNKYAEDENELIDSYD